MPSKTIPAPQSPLLDHQMDLFVQVNGLSLRIPHRYLEERLKSLGPYYFNSASSASCKISFIDLPQRSREREGSIGGNTSKEERAATPSTTVSTNSFPSNPRKRSFSSLSSTSLDAHEYWGHELFLSSRSQWFRDFFANHYDRKGVHDPRADYVSDENGHWLRILVNVREPSKSRVDELLYWIYTGNDDRWLHNAFTPKNYTLIAENVRILGLDAEAMAVCARYKALLVCPRCLLTRTESESEADSGRCESRTEEKSFVNNASDMDNKCIERGRTEHP